MFWLYVSSFAISALMGMGIGGGGLFVIYLTLCLNYSQLLAQGTNLLFFIISAISSCLIHLKRRKIKFAQVSLLIIFGSVGSFIFSNLVNHIDSKIPKIALGVLLILSGLYTLIKSLFIKKDKKF